MTFILIIGAVAGLYLFWLLFRLASLALPVYAGMAAALFLLDAGFRYPSAVLAGFGAAIATLVAGRLATAFVRSPFLRLLVGLLFAAPAGFAGYQAGRAIIGLATANDIVLVAASSIAGLATATSAWRGIAPPDAPARLPQYHATEPAPTTA